MVNVEQLERIYMVRPHTGNTFGKATLVRGVLKTGCEEGMLMGGVSGDALLRGYSSWHLYIYICRDHLVNTAA